MPSRDLVEKVARAIDPGLTMSDFAGAYTPTSRIGKAVMAAHRSLSVVAEELRVPTSKMMMAGDRAEPELPSIRCDTRLELAMSRVRPVWLSALSVSPLMKDEAS